MKKMKEMIKGYVINHITNLIEEKQTLRSENTELKERLKEKRLDEYEIKCKLMKEVIEDHLKDRIEFAIAELEKVKESIKYYVDNGFFQVRLMESKVVKQIDKLKEYINE